MSSTLREQMVEVCRCLWKRNMLAAADGNVSYKISDDEILITPSGRPKARLAPEEMVAMNSEGQPIGRSTAKPSGEKFMHLSIYKNCPRAKAVVHAHPPYAVAWTVARRELKSLPAEALSEVILACGDIPIAPYATPGSDDMGRVLEEFLPERRVIILARHGALAWGESLEEALGGMERVEHIAQTLYLAEGLGGITSLSPEEVQKLRRLREKMGEKIY